MLVRDLVQATLQQQGMDVDRLVVEREAEHAPKNGPKNGGEVRFLTNAARVLATVTKEPGATLRDIARRCGQTERAVWQQLRQLEQAGLLRRQREGRRNRYQVDESAVERHIMVESAALMGSG